MYKYTVYTYIQYNIPKAYSVNYVEIIQKINFQREWRMGNRRGWWVKIMQSMKLIHFGTLWYLKRAHFTVINAKVLNFPLEFIHSCSMGKAFVFNKSKREYVYTFGVSLPCYA